VPNLSIKNVPDEVVRKLRARARANHRSLQGELLELACRAAQMPDAAVTPSDRRLRGEPGGSKPIEQILAEHQKRQQRPRTDAPSSVELIRRERDAR